MAINSKRKGNRGELQACEMLAGLGLTARRAQQYAGRGSPGDVLIEEFPQLYVEVKFGYDRKDFDIGSALWWDAVRQTVADTPADWGWILLWRNKGARLGWRLTTMIQGILTTVPESEMPAVFAAISRYRGPIRD